VRARYACMGPHDKYGLSKNFLFSNDAEGSDAPLKWCDARESDPALLAGGLEGGEGAAARFEVQGQRRARPAGAGPGPGPGPCTCSCP
jgi:hypothetical protein